MKTGKIFTKLYVASMIMTNALTSCTKKPFTQMPSEMISKEAQKEIVNYRQEAKELLKDTAYVCFGKDTLLFNGDFGQRLRYKAEQNVEKITVGKKIVPVLRHYDGKTYITSRTKYLKEDKFINPKAVVKDSSVFTTDSVDIYLPVEYYGIPNPKAIPMK